MRRIIGILLWVWMASCKFTTSHDIKIRGALSQQQLDTLPDRMLVSNALQSIHYFVYELNRMKDFDYLTRGQQGLYHLSLLDSQLLKSGFLSYMKTNNGVVPEQLKTVFGLTGDSSALEILQSGEKQFALYSDIADGRSDSVKDANVPLFAIFALDSTYNQIRDESARKFADYIRRNKYLFFEVK